MFPDREENMERLICLVVGYCFGLIQTSYIIGRIKGIDIRKKGSGNAGTTNSIRVMGWKFGLITMACDIMKCIVPVLIMRAVYASTGSALLLGLWTAAGVVLGHDFPFYLKFKGGKGIATSAAVMMGFDWRMGLCCLVIFVVVVAATRYVSLASTLLSAALIAEILIFYPGRWDLFVLIVLYAGFAIYRHRANIKRLLAGTESKLGQKVEVKK